MIVGGVLAGAPGNEQVVPVAVQRKSAPTAPPLGRISESVGANLELLSMGIIGLQTDLPENGSDGAQRGVPKTGYMRAVQELQFAAN